MESVATSSGSTGLPVATPPIQASMTQPGSASLEQEVEDPRMAQMEEVFVLFTSQGLTPVQAIQQMMQQVGNVEEIALVTRYAAHKFAR